MLSNEEKIEIINQHLRSLAYLDYNAQIDKIEAEAVTPVDKSLVNAINEKIASVNKKISALEDEKAKLS